MTGTGSGSGTGSGVSLPGWASVEMPLPELLRGLEARRRGHPMAVEDEGALDRADRLGEVGARFAAEDDPLRAQALAALSSGEVGYSGPMARAVLDGLAVDWSPERLRRLLLSEFGAPPWGAPRSVPRSPSVHVCSGNVPGVSVTSLIRGLLVGSAVLLKPARADRELPVLFHSALRDAAPALADRAAVRYWQPDEAGVDEVMRAAASVVVYGGEEAIRWARGAAGANTHLVEYPHRVSVLLVTESGLTADTVNEGIASAAMACAMFDQRGCVSPHAIYVVRGGARAPEAWAESLAHEMDTLSRTLPAGRRTASEASAFHQEAGRVEMEQASGTATRVWGAGEPWRVVYRSEPGFEPSCLGRFVRVYPVDDARDAARVLGGLKPWLQTVGVVGALDDGERAEIVGAGALRIVDVDQVPWPPAWARLDGVEPLRSLVRWEDGG